MKFNFSFFLSLFTIGVVLLGLFLVNDPAESALMICLLLALLIIALAWTRGIWFGGVSGLISGMLVIPSFHLVNLPGETIWPYLSICYLAVGILVGQQSSIYRKMEVANEQLSLLNLMGTTINRLLSVNQLHSTALAQISNLLRPDIIQLFELDADKGVFVLKAARPPLPEQSARIPVTAAADEGIFGMVMRSQRVEMLGEPFDNLHLRPSSVPAEIASLIAVPLKAEDRVGTVLLMGRRGVKGFSAKDQQLVESIGQALTVALENALLFQHVRDQSFSDELTKLGNRRMFNLRLEMELDQAHMTRAPLCLAALDLDHFKIVNDTYGHPAGDAVLIQFASRAREQIRATDLLCRTGGEEFSLLTPNTPLPFALIIANRILQAIAVKPFLLDDGTAIPVTASIGVAAMTPPLLDGKSLLAAADDALYAAKANGRNRVEQHQATQEAVPS